MAIWKVSFQILAAIPLLQEIIEVSSFAFNGAYPRPSAEAFLYHTGKYPHTLRDTADFDHLHVCGDRFSSSAGFLFPLARSTTSLLIHRGPPKEEETRNARDSNEELERQLLQLQYLSDQFEQYLMRKDQEKAVNENNNPGGDWREKREAQRQKVTKFVSRLEKLQNDLEVVERRLHENDFDIELHCIDSKDNVQSSSSSFYNLPRNKTLPPAGEGSKLRWREPKKPGRLTAAVRGPQLQLQNLSKKVTLSRTLLGQAFDQVVDKLFYEWPEKLAIQQRLNQVVAAMKGKRRPPAKIILPPMFIWQKTFQILPRARVNRAMLYVEPRNMLFRRTLFLPSNTTTSKAVPLSTLLEMTRSATFPLSPTKTSTSPSSDPTAVIWSIPQKLTASIRSQITKRIAVCESRTTKSYPFLYAQPLAALDQNLDSAQSLPHTTWPDMLELDCIVKRFLLIWDGKETQIWQ